MKVICPKPDAAVRQLDVAIGALFTDGDPLAIRTLAGAAYGIFADLAEHQKQGSSWRTKLFEDSGVSKDEGRRILHAAQNYLKHADWDPHSLLEFDEEENDHLIFMASAECGDLGHPLSFSMQAFQVWYLAMYPEKIGLDMDPVKTFKKIFPGLSMNECTQQLAHGHRFLKDVWKHKGLL
ncbi:MAG: hypothetical protein QE265_00750 [Rhodoferax sp.]|nr:hypothetical protein [Rhodoferax sp.]